MKILVPPRFRLSALVFSSIVLALIIAVAGPGLGSGDARSAEERAAVNVYSVAKAARAAGYAGQWATAADLVRDMEKGVEIDLAGTRVHFKVAPLSEAERAFAIRHIAIKNQDPVWKP
jgi:hypothetical protein